MIIGIMLVVGGTAALFAAMLTSLISVLYMGFMLVIAGVLEMISAFRVRHTGPHLVYLLAGLLAIVVGALFIYHPLASLASVTLLLAGYLFASGMFRGLAAIVERHPRWGWDLAYALVTLGLGIYVAASWPLSSFWLLGTFVAIEIIARGISLVSAAWALREVEHGDLRSLDYRRHVMT